MKFLSILGSSLIPTGACVAVSAICFLLWVADGSGLSGEMGGPGVAVYFYLSVILLLAALFVVFASSVLILWLAGFSWRLLWWISGICSVICLACWWMYCTIFGLM